MKLPLNIHITHCKLQYFLCSILSYFIFKECCAARRVGIVSHSLPHFIVKNPETQRYELISSRSASQEAAETKTPAQEF